LTRHIKAIHRIGHPKSKCAIGECPFTSRRKDNLAQHIRTVHPNQSTRPADDIESLGYPPQVNGIAQVAHITSTPFHEIGLTAFMEAASTGNSALLERVLDMGVDVNVQAEDGYTALHCAAKTGQLVIISLLLTKGAAVDPLNTKIQERRPIHEAISARHVEAIAMLLHAGADILLPNAQGQTVIEYTGLVGDLQAAQTLFSEERKQKSASEMASLLFMACVKSGNHLTLSWLLSKFPNAFPQYKSLKESPIYMATKRGHDKIVEILLSSIAPSGQSTAEFTKTITHSLLPAASKSSGSLVQRLLMYDAIDPNQKADYSHTSPLHNAVCKGNSCGVETLLNHPKINPNCKDRWANTPVHFAATSGHIDVIRLLLLRKDIDVQSKNDCGRTPLDEAFFNYKWNALRLIAEHQNLTAELGPEFTAESLPNAQPDQDRLLVSHLFDRGILSTKPSDYYALLAIVIVVGALEVVKFLVGRLSLDNDAFLESWSGCNVLHVAAKHHHHDIFRFYLENSRIDVNKLPWGYDETALNCAIQHNCMTAVKLLLARPEIDLTSRNYGQKTALDLARALGKREMFELLLSHGTVGQSLEMDPTIVDKHAGEPSCWTAQDEEQLRSLNVCSNVVEVDDSDIDYDSEEYEDVDMSF
jgi:ankyrin repeat protein